MSKFNPSESLLTQINQTQVSVHAIVAAEENRFLAHCECISMVSLLLIDLSEQPKERKYCLETVLAPLDDSQIKWLKTICLKMSKGIKANGTVIKAKAGKFAKVWARVSAKDRKKDGALANTLRDFVVKNELGEKRKAEKFDTAKRTAKTKDEAPKTDIEPEKVLEDQAQAIEKYGVSENVLGFKMEPELNTFVLTLTAKVNAVYPGLLDDPQGRNWLSHAVMRFDEDNDRRLAGKQGEQLKLVKSAQNELKSQATVQAILNKAKETDEATS